MTRTMTMTLSHEMIEEAIAEMLKAKGYFSFDTEILNVDLALSLNDEGLVTFDLEVLIPESEVTPGEDRNNLDSFLKSAVVLPFEARV